MTTKAHNNCKVKINVLNETSRLDKHIKEAG